MGGSPCSPNLGIAVNIDAKRKGAAGAAMRSGAVGWNRIPPPSSARPRPLSAVLGRLQAVPESRDGAPRVQESFVPPTTPPPTSITANRALRFEAANER